MNGYALSSRVLLNRSSNKQITTNNNAWIRALFFYPGLDSQVGSKIQKSDQRTNKRTMPAIRYPLTLIFCGFCTKIIDVIYQKGQQPASRVGEWQTQHKQTQAQRSQGYPQGGGGLLVLICIDIYLECVKLFEISWQWVSIRGCCLTFCLLVGSLYIWLATF